jgi:hypothetical protein
MHFPESGLCVRPQQTVQALSLRDLRFSQTGAELLVKGEIRGGPKCISYGGDEFHALPHSVLFALAVNTRRQGVAFAGLRL